MRTLFRSGLFFLFFAVLFVTPKIYAAATFGSGVYTNICGTGTDASRNLCNQGCNINSGFCNGRGNSVVKFTCDGRQTECKSNEQPFSSSYSLAGTTCGKTVQIDVFTRNCRVSGGWDCGNNDMVDYITWYSGDCPPPTGGPTATPTPVTPTATPTPIPTSQISSCDSLTVVSGDGAIVPANVTFRVKGQDNKGDISGYRVYFGDSNSTETDKTEVSHRYFSSGTFNVRADIRDTAGNWKTSDACMKTVTIKPVPVLESHKADCSNIFITQGNQTTAPTTAKFTVTGYDNKGAIKKYRVDYGDGTNETKTTPDFSKQYDKPGTYEVKGYITDTEDVEHGGVNTCKTSLYVNTQAMQVQPDTGTPTLFTMLAMGCGGLSLLLVAFRKRIIG